MIARLMIVPLVPSARSVVLSLGLDGGAHRLHEVLKESVPVLRAGPIQSETGCEQRPAQPRATDHSDRHGVIRGIQRGTAARNASYSFPNVCSSVGSSYATTKAWKASQSSAP